MSIETGARAVRAMRWVVLIPAAFIGAGLAQVVFVLMAQHAYPGAGSGLDALYVRTASNAVLGAVAVWAAAQIAPNHKSHAAVFVAGLLAAGSLAVLLTEWGDARDTYAVVVSIIAALVTCAEMVRTHRTASPGVA